MIALGLSLFALLSLSGGRADTPPARAAEPEPIPAEHKRLIDLIAASQRASRDSLDRTIARRLEPRRHADD